MRRLGKNVILILDSNNYGWDPLGSNMEEALITLIYYGYGNNADVDYVYCRLVAADGVREPLEEYWEATTN